jgi:peptide/nickel transport system permease protein
MMRHAMRRLGWAVLVIWAVVTLAFFVNNVLPSDPARMIAGPQARPQDVQRIRAQLGLDQPLLTQYGVYMRRLLHVGASTIDPKNKEHATCTSFGPIHVDLGRSYLQRRPVVTILAERVPRSLMLAGAAIVVQLAIGVTLGVIAAAKRRTIWDGAAVAASLIGVSAPTFILGLLLQFVLANKMQLLPLDGFGQTPAEHLTCLVLPALTLGVFGAAYYTRLVRDEMIGLMKQDFVRTAYAKGAAPFAVLVRHALRNALVPLVTMVGLDLGALVGGAIVTETVFRWPGLGAISVTALLDRDGPLILGTVLVTSTAVVLSSVLVDLCCAALDPRVRK